MTDNSLYNDDFLDALQEDSDLNLIPQSSQDDRTLDELLADVSNPQPSQDDQLDKLLSEVVVNIDLAEIFPDLPKKELEEAAEKARSGAPGFLEAAMPRVGDIPFVGMVSDVASAVDMYNAAGAVESGTATLDQQRLVVDQIVQEARGEGTIANRITEGAQGVGTLGLEFLAGSLVGGGATATARAGARAGLKALEGRLGQRLALQASERALKAANAFAKTTVGKGGAALVGTVALQEGVPRPFFGGAGQSNAYAVSRLLDDLDDAQSRDTASAINEQIAQLMDPGMLSMPNAKGFAELVMMNTMEMTVGAGLSKLGKGAKGLAVKNVPPLAYVTALYHKALQRSVAGITKRAPNFTKAMRVLQDLPTFNGVVEELAEEYIQNVTSEAVFGDDWRDGLPEDFEEVAVMAASFSVLPVIGVATKASVNSALKVSERVLAARALERQAAAADRVPMPEGVSATDPADTPTVGLERVTPEQYAAFQDTGLVDEEVVELAVQAQLDGTFADNARREGESIQDYNRRLNDQEGQQAMRRLRNMIETGTMRGQREMAGQRPTDAQGAPRRRVGKTARARFEERMAEEAARQEEGAKQDVELSERVQGAVEEFARTKGLEMDDVRLTGRVEAPSGEQPMSNEARQQAARQERRFEAFALGRLLNRRVLFMDTDAPMTPSGRAAYAPNSDTIIIDGRVENPTEALVHELVHSALQRVRMVGDADVSAKDQLAYFEDRFPDMYRDARERYVGDLGAEAAKDMQAATPELFEEEVVATLAEMMYEDIVDLLAEARTPGELGKATQLLTALIEEADSNPAARSFFGKLLEALRSIAEALRLAPKRNPIARRYAELAGTTPDEAASRARALMDLVALIEGTAYGDFDVLADQDGNLRFAPMRFRDEERKEAGEALFQLGGSQQRGLQRIQEARASYEISSRDALDVEVEEVDRDPDVGAAITPGGIARNGYAFPRIYVGGPLLTQAREDSFLGTGEGTQQEGRGHYGTSFIKIGGWYAEAYKQRGALGVIRTDVPDLGELFLEDFKEVQLSNVAPANEKLAREAQQLLELLRELKFEPPQSVNLAEEVASALTAAHVAKKLIAATNSPLANTTWAEGLERLRSTATAAAFAEQQRQLARIVPKDARTGRSRALERIPLDAIKTAFAKLADQIEGLVTDTEAPLFPQEEFVAANDIVLTGLSMLFGRNQVLELMLGEKVEDLLSAGSSALRPTRALPVTKDSAPFVNRNFLLAAVYAQMPEQFTYPNLVSEVGKFEAPKMLLDLFPDGPEDDPVMPDQLRDIGIAGFIDALQSSLGRQLRAGDLSVPQMAGHALLTDGFVHEERITAPRNTFLWLNGSLNEQPHQQVVPKLLNAIADLMGQAATEGLRARSAYWADLAEKLTYNNKLSPITASNPMAIVANHLGEDSRQDMMDLLSSLGFRDSDAGQSLKPGEPSQRTTLSQAISDTLLKYGIRGYEYFGNGSRGPYLNFVTFSSADVQPVRARELGVPDLRTTQSSDRVSMQVNVSMNRFSIPGMERLSREAIEGGVANNTKLSLLSDLMDSAIEDVLSDIPHQKVVVPTVGVYQGEMEVAFQVHLNIFEGQSERVVDRIHRLGLNFAQDSVHILEALPDQTKYEALDKFKKKPDSAFGTGEGQVVTPVVTFDVDPAALESMQSATALEAIDAVMKEVGLDALTYNPATSAKRGTVSAYYAGDPNDIEEYRQWVRQIDQALRRLGGNYARARRHVAVLHNIGDADYSRIAYKRDASALPIPVNPNLRRNKRSLIYRTAEQFYNDTVRSNAPFAIFGGRSGLNWDEATQKQRAGIVRDYFERLPRMNMSNPMVAYSYGWLCKELLRQFDSLPVRVETISRGPDAKYPSSSEVRREIRQNNRIVIDITEPGTHGPDSSTFDLSNPLLHYAADSAVSGLADDPFDVRADAPDTYKPKAPAASFAQKDNEYVGSGADAEGVRRDMNGVPLRFNDLLRVVHDYYAHGLTDNNFLIVGEEGARRTHLALTNNPFAMWALMTETYGQNSWVNTRPGMEGKSAREKGFAEQKVALLPLQVAMMRSELRRTRNTEGGPLRYKYAKPRSLATQLRVMLQSSESLKETIGVRSRTVELNRALLKMFESPFSPSTLRQELFNLYSARNRPEGMSQADFKNKRVELEKQAILEQLSDSQRERVERVFASGNKKQQDAVSETLFAGVVDQMSLPMLLNELQDTIREIYGQTLLPGKVKNLDFGAELLAEKDEATLSFADVLGLSGSQEEIETQLERELFGFLSGTGKPETDVDANAKQAYRIGRQDSAIAQLFPPAFQVAAYELVHDARMVDAVEGMQHIAATFNLVDGPSGSLEDEDPAEMSAKLPPLRHAPYRNGRARFDNGAMSTFDGHVISTASVRGQRAGDLRMRRRLMPGIKAYNKQQKADAARYLRLTPFGRRFAGEDDDKVINEAVKAFRKNALFLYDLYPEELREQARLWYAGGNKLCNEMAQRHKVSVPAAVSIMAVHSPQTEWMVNVARADQTMDLYQNYQDAKWDNEIVEWAQAYSTKDKSGNVTYPYLEDGVLEAIQNKTLRELISDAVAAEQAAEAMPLGKNKKSSEYKARSAAIQQARSVTWRYTALWARAFARFNLREDYDVFSPSGNAVGLMTDDDGNVRRMGFMGLSPIWKGFRILHQNASVQVIDKELGEANKVRSFYMNLLFPNDMHGEVTNDTHNIAALAFMPLGSSAELVAQGLAGGHKGFSEKTVDGKKIKEPKPFWKEAGVKPFGVGNKAETGVAGLYAVFADAIREAAQERGVLPREMQSIVWEAVRGLMENRKTDARKSKSDAIWKRYGERKISLPEAQRQLFALYPGIDYPTWDGRNLRVVDTNGTIKPIEGKGAAMAGAGNRPGAIQAGGATVAGVDVRGLPASSGDPSGGSGRRRARRNGPLRNAPRRTLSDVGYRRMAVAASELQEARQRYERDKELSSPTATVGVLTFSVRDLQTMAGVNDERVRMRRNDRSQPAAVTVFVTPTGEPLLDGELPDDGSETVEAAVEWFGGAERGDGDWSAQSVAKKAFGPQAEVGAERLRSASSQGGPKRPRMTQRTTRERAAALSRELIRRGEALPPVADPASTGLVPEQSVEAAPVTASSEPAPAVTDEPTLQEETDVLETEGEALEQRPQEAGGAGAVAPDEAGLAETVSEPASAAPAPQPAAGGLFPSEADEVEEQVAADAAMLEPPVAPEPTEQETGVPVQPVVRDKTALNNPGNTAEERALWEVVDADRAAKMEDIVGGKDAETMAREALRDDYNGTRRRLENKLRNGSRFKPFEHRALANIVSGLFVKALDRNLSQEERAQALSDGRELGVAFREMRANVARELGATVGLGMTAKEETLLMLMQLPAEEERRRAKIRRELKNYIRPDKLGPQGQYVQTFFAAQNQEGSEFDLRNAPDFNPRGQKRTQARIDKLLEQDAEITAMEAVRYERAAKALQEAGYDAFIQEDPDALLDPQHGHIIRNIISSAKATWSDKAMELRQSMLLTGLFTHKVNLYGNVGMLAMNGVVQKLVESLVADSMRALGLATDIKNAPRLQEMVPYLMGGVRAVPAAVQNFMRAIRTEGPIFEMDLKRGGTAFGEYTQRYDTAHGVKIAGKKGKAARLFSFSLLLGMDELFKTIAGGMAASGLAWRQAYAEENLRGDALQRRIDELLADKSNDLWTEALYFAREVTFQDEGGEVSQMALKALNALTGVLDRASQLIQLPLGTVAQKLGVEGANRDQNLYLPLGVLLVPFRKVPLRIPAQALRRSPLGPPVMMAKALANQEYDGDTALLVRDIADGFIAMGVTMAIMQLLDDDDDQALPTITGSRAASKGEREAQFRTAPPESIRLGDTYYQYSRLDPLGTTLVMIVDGVQKYRQTGLTESLSTGVASLMATMKDKTVLRSLGDVLYTIEQARRGTDASEETVAKLLRSLYVTPWVPNLVRQTARETSDTYKLPRTIVEDGYPAFMTDDFFDSDGEPIATGLTGVAPAVKRDLWGRPVRRVKGDGLSSSFVARLIKPAKVQQLVSDVSPIDVALVRVNERIASGELQDEDQYFPTLPTRTLTIRERRNGRFTGESEQRRMTNPQYSAFLRDSGQAAHKALLDLVRDEENGYEFSFSEDSNAAQLQRLSRRVARHLREKLRKRKDWDGNFNIDDPGPAELYAIRTAKNYAYMVTREQMAQALSGQ